MESRSQDPIIRLGPIIGKVTNTTARLTIELESSQEVTCTLTSSTGKQIICRRVPENGFPTVFKFSELEPQTLYKVSLDNNTLNSQFRTLRNENEKPGKLNIGIVSCNEVTKAEIKPSSQNLWDDLAKRAHELDYVLHIGDQCYMDMGEETTQQTPYQICQKRLNSVQKDQWPSLTNELLEVLRAHYRRTWSIPGTSFVLANVPNLMLLDDHEVRDDWGWRQEDYDPNTAKCDYFYGQLARRVYYEYQRQLREDIDWNNLDSLKCEYHEHILNGVGIVFVDYRGSRSWFREDFNEKSPQLGTKQAEWVQSLFVKEGKFKDLNSVLFISAIPMLFFSHLLTNTAAMAGFDDVKEHWSYKNDEEMKKILNLLKDWKAGKKGRELTLIGGDVHIGGHTDLFFGKKGVFKQFTTSAINNIVTKKYQFSIMKFFQKLSGNLGKEFSYQHYDWVKESNYGLVSISVNGEASIVECKLVIGGENGITVQEPHFNNVWNNKPEKVLCCNIF